MISWIIYWAFISLTMIIDRKIRAQRAQQRGVVDFTDSNPVSYLALGLLAPCLVLPIYFYSSRKVMGGSRLGAVLAGIGLSVACLVPTVVITVPILLVSAR
jgi:hypothetical protein